MECAHPHRCSSLWPLQGDALGHLARGLVRIGENEDSAWVYTFVEQLNDALRKRLRLARSWTRFEKISGSPVVRCGSLLGVQASFAANTLLRLDLRQEKGVDKLLRDDIEGSLHAFRNLRCGQAVFEVHPPHQRSRQKQLSGKQIHLDLAPLSATVVDDTVHSDRRRFRSSRLLDVFGCRDRGVAELRMAYLVSDQERAIEYGALVLMDDEVVFRDIGGTAIVQARGPGSCLFHGQPTLTSRSLRESVGITGVKAYRDRESV
ncbi:hypothetical protein GGQ64_003625 [Rhizobium azooxidifex]|uniref:Uncharacterized protein n=1 Tax=Mycoplana azooxidifex TaxID=1636188 RepID=A0A7W6GJU6_9HYPH|nr:hypothetical protein [Mycoplana azooxidifex]